MRAPSVHASFLALGLVAAFAVSGPAQGDSLYEAFRNPPAHLRPFVRWWWNGSRVSEPEIHRQLDVLQAAGVGGVEINTIAMPEDVPAEGLERFPERPWLSEPWCRAVRAAAEGARQRGMTADIIVGSGWPFGGRFLAPEERTRRVRVVARAVTGPTTFEAAIVDLAARPEKARDEVATDPEVLFVRLSQAEPVSFDPGIELGASAVSGARVSVDVPEGPHVVRVGLLETGFTHVKLGAPGADGPVLDHWNAEAVQRFLDRMATGLAPALGGHLGEARGGPLRASFVDSLELDHANWTTDLPAEFSRRRGYDVTPYLPFLLEPDDLEDESSHADTVRRARYDFNRTLVELFHERFVRTYVDWAHENGLLARIQAYGRETHVLDGSLLVDLPEGESWLWSDHDRIVVSPTVANKYVSSAAHLAGRGPVSFEAMTNAVPVFREMPEDFKVGMDQSLLAGVHHPVLHGFNYSPPEAGFPGWVRFGSWFSEQNPWWSHVRRITDYAARLTTVLSQAEFQAGIALLGPRADEWARDGRLYQPFPEVSRPWYHYHLWAALQQAGYGTDMVSERVLRESSLEGSRLKYGSRVYHTLILMELVSIQPETAQAIGAFARAGGRVLFVGRAPARAPGLKDAAASDRRVEQIFAELAATRHDRARVVDAPSSGLLPPGDYTRGVLPDGARRELLRWVVTTMARFGIDPAVRIAAPHPDVGLVYHRHGERHLWFLANASRTDARTIEARVPIGAGRPWRWDPETGERAAMPASRGADTLTLALEPAGSLLVVFEPLEASGPADDPPGLDASGRPRIGRQGLPVVARWEVELRPAGGTPFSRQLSQLFDLSLAVDDEEVASFGGVARYRAEFDWRDDTRTLLSLGTVHGVSSVRLNGVNLGVRWWGRHLYDASAALAEGRNLLEIEITTSLGNRMRSLKADPVAQRWAWWFPPIPTGLVGPVQLMRPAENAVP